MKPYQNLNGNSNIQSFQIYGDGIKVKFDDGTILLYLEEKIGKEIVDRMKMLAAEGKGLGTFIGESAQGLGQNPDS